MPNGDNKSRIQTPLGSGHKLHSQLDHKMVYILPNSQGQKVHVVEMPACRFGGLTVCLASTVRKDIAKMEALRPLFHQFWNDMAQKMENGIIPRLPIL